MSGTVALSQNERWSHQSWAYHWVLEFLMSNVSDREVVASLREIDRSNGKWIAIYEFNPSQRHEIFSLLTTSLVSDARRRLPRTWQEREIAITVFGQLADQSRKYVPNRVSKSPLEYLCRRSNPTGRVAI